MIRIVRTFLFALFMFTLLFPSAVFAVEQSSEEVKVNVIKEEQTQPQKATEEIVDFNDPAGTALGKYKNATPKDLKSIIVKKGTEGVSIIQLGASYIVIIAFIVSLIVVATGPAFQHGYTMYGWAGMVFSLISYAGIMNAPMIVYLFNKWATP